MISNQKVFFEGRRSYRASYTIDEIKIGIYMVVGCWGLSIVRFALTPTGDDLELDNLYITLLTLGSLAFVILLYLIWNYATGRIKKLIISESGVSYGRTHWSWFTVTAIQARPAPPDDELTFYIWVNTEKGEGRMLPIDNPLSAMVYADLQDNLTRFFATHGIKTRCL